MFYKYFIWVTQNAFLKLHWLTTKIICSIVLQADSYNSFYGFEIIPQ